MDLLVVVVAFLVGYWVVSALMERKKALPGDPAYAGWFRVLEVREDADAEEIASAYRAKIGQYHPDKVAQMGAEIRALAEQKSSEINAAYDYAMKLRAARGSDR